MSASSVPAGKTHDVVVFGAGPAGLAAAIRARQLGLDVVVIAAPPARRQCCGWIGPAGVALLAELGVDARAAKATPFDKLRIHSWDFRKNVLVSDGESKGWFVDRGAFDAALLAVARKAKAAVRSGAAVTRLTLRDDRIEAGLDDGTDVAGRFAVIADGGASEIAAHANLLAAHRLGGLAQAMFANFEGGKAGGELDVAIGASRHGQVAVLTRDKQQTRLMVATRPSPVPVETLFQQVRDAARAAGVLNGAPRDEPCRVLIPAGAALDLETHVGKRCLLVGDAGGFVGAFSHEGIFPALRSGGLAAEVIAAAAPAHVPQDELARFSEAWRTQLADYLRMPNTDLSLLMPLIFSNAQMSRRVARAFLLGQAF